jgi:hypothetical protein
VADLLRASTALPWVKLEELVSVALVSSTIEGHDVRIVMDGPILVLTPEQAGHLSEVLERAATDAVHASRSARRAARCPACRMGLPTHDERDPQCEARRG